jgi:hypothetical protein
MTVFRRFERSVQVFDKRSGIDGRTERNKDSHLLEVAGAGSGIELRGERIAFPRADNQFKVYMWRSRWR